jgi:hypothetical protein
MAAESVLIYPGGREVPRQPPAAAPAAPAAMSQAAYVASDLPFK